MPEESKEPTEHQVAETVSAPSPETEKPQVMEPTAGLTPGAEKEPEAKLPERPLPPVAKPEKTYTQVEVDKALAESRQVVAQLHRQREIERLQAQEANAQAVDRAAVEAGDITEAEAAGRPQERFEAWRRQQQSQLEEFARVQANAEADEKLRFVAAFEMAKDYGINAKDLLADKGTVDPVSMKAKALELALEKTRGELKAMQAKGEKFDSGQVGVTGEDTSKLSPRERARREYEKVSTGRR